MAIELAAIDRRKRIFQFEHRYEPLLPRAAFVSRLAWSLAIGGAVIVSSLLVGMAGYRYTEGLQWIDAYINDAMILSGMGPLAQPQTVAGKLFAGTYALYSGFIILLAAGIVFA